jgi:membrane protease YdiL (CAAX protease family)
MADVFVRSSWATTLAGFVVLWVVLDRIAAATGSTSGEAGIAVCAGVIVAAVAIEWLLSGRSPVKAAAALGLGAPNARSLVATIVIAGLLLSFYPVFATITGAELSLRDGWVVLLPGLFAQGGIAEETVFRGFLFRRLRGADGFWRGALRAAAPFVLVHLALFLNLDFPIALAAVALSLIVSFPLSWLFAVSGGSVWPGALLHFIVQGSIKLVDAGAQHALMAICWMGFVAGACWLVFLVRPAP